MICMHKFNAYESILYCERCAKIVAIEIDGDTYTHNTNTIKKSSPPPSSIRKRSSRKSKVKEEVVQPNLFAEANKFEADSARATIERLLAEKYPDEVPEDLEEMTNYIQREIRTYPDNDVSDTLGPNL